MRINSVLSNVAFQRNLTPQEVKEYSAVLEQGKQLVGQTGKTILIMPSSCLPQTAEFNSGIGHFSSDIAQDYIKYLKTYLGIDVVEDLPAGQVPNNNKYHCAYKGSALALGNHQINPELLTTDQFGRILSQSDIKEIADGNTSLVKNDIANFQNVMDAEGKQNTVLKKAFENFKKLDSSTTLQRDYAKYVESNKDWLNFPRYGEPDQEFFKFKQFLADEHLKIAKTKLNQNGIKLCGDCQIGFSRDEVKAFSKAFIKDAYIGANDWRTPALNFDKIFDETSEAHKLLKRKIQLCAKRYDMIRVDAAWLYVTPPIRTPKGTSNKELGSNLLNLMERWIKEVKGPNFDTKNIIYEFEAKPTDFKAFSSDGRLIQPLRNRVKIFTSQHMHSHTNDNWGFVRAFLEKKIPLDEFILGVSNHDTQPLRQIANGVSEEVKKGVFLNYKTDAINALAQELRIPAQDLQNPVNFAKAKWAEPMLGKNIMLFFWDLLGREECFDEHWKKDYSPNAYRNYALKVPTDYKTAYQKAIQSGYGFNPMDALEKLFIKKGYDKSNNALFQKIVKFKNILSDPKEYTPPEHIGKSPFTKALFIAVSILGIAAVYKYFKTKNKVEENLNVITNNTQQDVTPIGKLYSINEFTKK